MAKLYEKKIEVALFEIQKMFEYCHQNIDSTAFPASWGLLIYNNTLLLGTPYSQLMQGVYDEKNDPKYLEYCSKMKAVIMKYVDRDEQGNPIFDENKQPVFTDMNVEFTNEQEKLDKEYAELNEKIMNKDEVNYKFLKQKVQVKICACDLEDIPDGVPPSIVGIITKPEIK
jgi:hypothetical protein